MSGSNRDSAASEWILIGVGCHGITDCFIVAAADSCYNGDPCIVAGCGPGAAGAARNTNTSSPASIRDHNNRKSSEWRQVGLLAFELFQRIPDLLNMRRFDYGCTRNN
jgi:hypothetical protein